MPPSPEIIGDLSLSSFAKSGEGNCVLCFPEDELRTYEAVNKNIVSTQDVLLFARVYNNFLMSKSNLSFVVITLYRFRNKECKESASFQNSIQVKDKIS